MPKMLIDLSTEDAAKLRDLAAEHGHKLKPFVEYLLRMQIGSVPPPKVQPVKMQPAQATAQDKPTQAQPERSPAKVEALRDLLKPSAQVQPEKVTQTRTPKPWTPNRNTAAYTEEVDPGSGIFTDGKSFAVQYGPVGHRGVKYFEDLAEAEEFAEEQREVF